MGLVALALALHLRWPVGVVGQGTYLFCTLGAGVVALVSARRLPAAAARPWRWVALGLLSSAVGDAYYALHAELAPPVPGVSAADPGWLLSYVFLIAAMLVLLRDRRVGIRSDIEGLIDTAMAIVVSCLVLWQLAVQPVLSDPAISSLTRIVWAAYPVLDAVLLAVVLRVILSRRAISSVGGLLACGTVCWMAADLTSMFVEWDGAALRAMDAAWMVGPVLIAGGAWRAALHHRRGPVDHDEPRFAAATPRRVQVWSLALTVIPLLVPGLLELLAVHRGDDLHPLQAVIGTAVIAALVLGRSVNLLRNRDEAERLLASSERYFRALAVNSANSVLVLDVSGRITNESDHLTGMLQLNGQQLRGSRVADLVCAEDLDVARALYARAAAEPGTVFEGELRIQCPNGKRPWFAVRLVNLLDDPDVAGIVVNFHSISDRKLAEAELTHLAFHDSLTGLANRGLFHDRVEHALETSDKPSAAVVYLDLDGFKHVNDGFGHDAGDELLREVATRLSRASRPRDTIARLGGDEFAILLERCDDPDGDAVAVADRILRQLTVPVVLEDGLVTLSASIGIASAEQTSTASSLLRDADVAMYQAKAGGRGRWVRYAPEMRAATLERLQLEHDLATALERDELRVVYQPVVELDDGAIVGFEALLRWEHPSLGVISPDRFIPIAEETGLIIPIGRWVLETACRQAARWRRSHAGHGELTMAVNVSARQLASSDLVSHVEDALAMTGLPARALVLEMTESVLVEDARSAAGWLRQLRRLGLRLAIDDFGTGYSSLSYLRQFPVDILKIDRSFVSTITHEMPPLVHGLIELGHTLQLELIAEGIEDQDQLQALREERCHRGQGFLFAGPVAAEEADVLLGVLRPGLALPPATARGYQREDVEVLLR